jgi:hypothetical protein
MALGYIAFQTAAPNAGLAGHPFNDAFFWSWQSCMTLPIPIPIPPTYNLATSCMISTESFPAVMQSGYGTTTHPFQGQRLQMGWNCNSSWPLCLHRHVMGWPSSVQSVHQPHGTRRSKIHYFWTTKFNPKLKSSCPPYNDRFKIPGQNVTKCFSLSVVLNDNANS